MLALGVPAGWDTGVLDPDGSAEVLVAGAAGPGTPGTPTDDLFEVVLLFCPDAAALAVGLPDAMAVTTTAGRCWVAWPKKSSPAFVDLTEDGVRAQALPVGWVDVKVCAVDAIWSGLCLVRRKENR